MAVLFLDVQGFTGIAETHKEKAMAMINRIWAAVEAPVYRNKGKINKYMGDAALVIFRIRAGTRPDQRSSRAWKSWKASLGCRMNSASGSISGSALTAENSCMERPARTGTSSWE